MTTAKWSIAHQGKKFLAATKREATELARHLADASGLSVTVRPVRGSSKTAAHRSVKSNPAPRPPPQPLRYVVRYAPKGGGPVQTMQFQSKATAENYLRDFRQRGIGATLTDTRPTHPPYRRNPDPGSFLPVWNEQEKGRRMRLDYLAATKGRRLAKGLRGRDRGGAVKAAERGAQKTAKFQVYGTKGKEQFHVGRSSRHLAEVTAEQLAAAGYKVRIVEGSIW